MLYNKEDIMNKKIISILVVILLAIGGAFVYKTLMPKGSEGSKAVTVNVIVASENINYTKEFKTDELLLEALFRANSDELGLTLTDTQYGPMVTGLKGYKADETKEFFNIKVNGVDSMVGIKEIPVNDKDVYTFEVKGF